MDFSIGGISAEYSSSLNNALTENVKSEAFKNSIEKAAASGEDKQLRQACNDFESYFIKMMFSAMRNTSFVSDDSFFAKSNAQNIFEDMLYEEYGNIIANSGNGIGLSDMLYKQLSKKEAYNPEDVINGIQGAENPRVDFEA